MDPARPSNPSNYLTLKQAAQSLAVSVDVLLSWNENNILKPTILPTGEVGYAKQQIDQFLKIRNSSQLTVAPNFLEKQREVPPSNQPFEIVTEKNTVSYNQQTNNFSQINNYNFYDSPPIKPNKKNKIIISLIGLAAGFFVLITSSILLLFYQENTNNNNSDVLAADTTRDSFKESGDLRESDQSLNNEGAAITKNRIASINRPSENRAVYASSAAKTNYKQAVLVEAVIGNGKADGKSPSLPDSTTTYNQKININENSDAENEVFDTEGNIKVSKSEEEENRLIATRLAMGGVSQNQGYLKQSSSSVGFVSFLIIGLFTFYVIYSKKRSLFPALEGSQNLDIQPQNSNAVEENPRILEVFQKTDGTVAMFFQSKEIKISKPELDSESDKFIERLMQLVGADIKEIEYDSLLDDSLSINTPLSKLVTRLGFVGVKRDLFFPRTSKTRVHFRKYLTADDLLSMNLTPDDVINGFLLNN